MGQQQGQGWVLSQCQFGRLGQKVVYQQGVRVQWFDAHETRRTPHQKAEHRRPVLPVCIWVVNRLRPQWLQHLVMFHHVRHHPPLFHIIHRTVTRQLLWSLGPRVQSVHQPLAAWVLHLVRQRLECQNLALEGDGGTAHHQKWGYGVTRE